jgi:hypothetical protein
VDNQLHITHTTGLTREAVDVLQFDVRHNKPFTACSAGFRDAAAKRMLRACVLWLLVHIHHKKLPAQPFWEFEDDGTSRELPIRYPDDSYLRTQLAATLESKIMGARHSQLEVEQRMLAAVGSKTGIAIADACVAIRSQISANGRKPFAELFQLMSAEGQWMSAWQLKHTHSLKEIGLMLQKFNEKDRWLADRYPMLYKKIWCCWIDDMPGDAPDGYKHPLGHYITSITTWRLGLFHMLQRITKNWISSVRQCSRLVGMLIFSTNCCTL